MSPTFQKIFAQKKVEKSNETSVKYRTSGNEMYRNKKYYQALKYYTASIKFAENDSSFLGLAYANRSAVLFEKKYYKECLEDIERALQSNYPEQLKHKLFKRQRDAEDLKPSQKPRQNYHIPPSIRNKNSVIDAASDAVEIKINKKFGRHIVATKDIKIGELIVVEKPYVQLIYPEHRLLHCHECLEFCYNMIPCKRCTTALYCSENCSRKAFTTYHRYECDFVDYFHKHPLLFMKVVTVGLQDSSTNNTDDNIYRSNRFKEIKALTTNKERRNPEYLVLSAVMACLAFHCLKSTKEFSQTFDLDKNESLVKELLYKCAMIENCNEFSIGKSIEGTCEVYIGEAIYSFISFFNNSCAPNCMQYFYSSSLVIRANANVNKGDQCMISYSCLYLHTPLHERQQIFQNGYYFKCECRACINNWPTIDHLPLGKEIPESFLRKILLILQVGHLNDATLNELLSEAFHIYNSLKTEEPCKNLALVEKYVRAIFITMIDQTAKF